MFYYTFLFWFWYRLGLAILAHFNWALSIYFGCAYFELWKSYDILWFWMHLVLCTCFPTLRSDNYLLVWFTMINKKWRTSPEKSFKEIYEDSYRKKKKRARTAYQNSIKEKAFPHIVEEDDDNVSRDSDIGSCGKSIDGENTVVNLYPAITTVSATNETETATFSTVGGGAQSSSQKELLLLPQSAGSGEIKQPAAVVSQISSATTGTAHSSETEKPMDVLKPDFTNKYDADVKDADLVAKELKREKKEKKALEKRLRKEQKLELARKAKEEARRQAIADAIGMLLYLLRVRVTFSILIGNIRKNFIGAQFKSSLSLSSIDALTVLFRATIFIDIALFWFTCQWANYLQCRLFCQLGICRFWLYAAILFVVGGLCMEMPMYWVQHKLDSSWCEFDFS